MSLSFSLLPLLPYINVELFGRLANKFSNRFKASLCLSSFSLHCFSLKKTVSKPSHIIRSLSFLHLTIKSHLSSFWVLPLFRFLSLIFSLHYLISPSQAPTIRYNHSLYHDIVDFLLLFLFFIFTLFSHDYYCLWC